MNVLTAELTFSSSNTIYYLDNLDTTKWVQVTITFIQQPYFKDQKVLFSASKDSNLILAGIDQSILYSALSQQQIFIDFEGYSQLNKKQVIRIPPGESSPILYLRVQNPRLFGTGLSFTILAEKMANGCINCEQICQSSQSVCFCDGLRVGRDCQEKGVDLRVGEKKNFTVQARKWSYALAQIENGVGTYNLQVNIKDSLYLGISFFFWGSDRGSVPNYDTNYYPVSNQNNYNLFYIPQKFIERVLDGKQTGKLILGMVLTQTDPEQAQVELIFNNSSSEEENKGVPTWALYLFTGLAICGVLFMIVVICAIIKGQGQQISANLTIVRSRVAPFNGVEDGLMDMYLPAQTYEDYLKKKKRLEKKKLREEQKNNETEKKQENETEKKQENEQENKIVPPEKKLTEQIEEECTICLQEFQKEDEIRKIICKHIFHKECIDQWVARNGVCPNCRKEHQKQHLEEYYYQLMEQKEQKKINQQQKSRQPSKNSLSNQNNLQQQQIVSQNDNLDVHDQEDESQIIESQEDSSEKSQSLNEDEDDSQLNQSNNQSKLQQTSKSNQNNLNIPNNSIRRQQRSSVQSRVQNQRQPQSLEDIVENIDQAYETPRNRNQNLNAQQNQLNTQFSPRSGNLTTTTALQVLNINQNR